MTDWPITFKCNNNCISCILTTTKNFDIEVPMSQIKAIIDNIKEDDYFGISGGEPTIRKEFFDILKYTRKKHPNLYIFIVSNGRMFSYKSFTKKLVDLNIGNFMIGIALYGHNKMIHEKITRAKNSFNQTVQGIKNLLSFNLPVEVRTVINKINYKFLPDIAKFIINNFSGVQRVVFINMKYTGNALKNKDKVFIRETDVVPYAEKAVDILLEKNINVKLYHFPLCIIKKKYWDLAKGVTKDKGELCFVKQCKDCKMKKECPMIWKTYVDIAGESEFRPIKS